MQFPCLAIELWCFFSQFRFGSCDHPQEESRFLCFLDAAADDAFKILFGNAFTGLAIIGTDTGSAASQLTDKPIICGIARKFPHKSHDRFAKLSSSLLQIAWFDWCK